MELGHINPAQLRLALQMHRGISYMILKVAIEVHMILFWVIMFLELLNRSDFVLKRIGYIIAILCLPFLCYLLNKEVNKMRTTPNIENQLVITKKPYIEATDNGYRVRLSEDIFIDFSKDRSLVNASGRVPIACNDFAVYIGQPFTAFTAVFGTPHADIGSGFPQYAYITNKGYLIVLSISDSNIVDIYELDLFANTEDLTTFF